MDLKKRLDSIERTELAYVLTGALLVGVAAIGLQYQERDVAPGDDQIQVSLTLEKPNETVRDTAEIGVNSTVFDAVNQSYEVEHTEYDFGYLVTSIDGLAQNRTHSWLYAVNNVSANTAVNNYVLSEDSNVTFSYTPNSEY
jgi:hypothetical protein